MVIHIILLFYYCILTKMYYVFTYYEENCNSFSNSCRFESCNWQSSRIFTQQFRDLATGWMLEAQTLFSNKSDCKVYTSMRPVSNPNSWPTSSLFPNQFQPAQSGLLCFPTKGRLLPQLNNMKGAFQRLTKRSSSQ